MLNEIVMHPVVRATIEDYTKISLRMHFKVLQALVKRIDELNKSGMLEQTISPQDIANIKLAAQAETSVQTYIWTYLNLCVERGDLDVLHKAWTNQQFRSNIMIAAVSFVHGMCANMINQDTLRVPQERSLADPIQDN